MTDESAHSQWLSLPDDLAAAGGRWAIAADENVRPLRRRVGGGASVYPAALLDGDGRPLARGELVVQDVWPTLRPMGQGGATTNAALDATWAASRAADAAAWSLGEVGQRLNAGPLLALRDGALVEQGKVARDDAKLEAAGLPAYASTDRRFARDAGDFRELSPGDDADVLNPGGGRMALRPAATATLAEHLKRLEGAVGEGSLLLAGRDVGTRWIEAAHLKIRLMASLLDGLGRRETDVPLGRLTVDDVEVLAPGDDAADRWAASARLAAPPAVAVELLDGRRVFLAPPAGGAGWPEADRAMRLDAANGLLRPHEPLAVPDGGAVRVRIDDPPLDLVAAPAEGEALAPATAVPDGQHAARVAVLPGRTASEDAEDLGRLFLEVLTGPANATATAGELVALVRRLLKSAGESVRLDTALRKAIEGDDELLKLLGPHRLIGGWLDAGPNPDAPAAAAVPMNVWSRLLTGCASLLPPFAGSDPAARLDALGRTLASLERMTASLLTGTWQVDREVAGVIRDVARERGLVKP